MEFTKFRYFSIDFRYIYRIFDRFSIDNNRQLSFSIEFERHISRDYPNYRVASRYFYFYSSRTRSRYINSYYRIVSALVGPKIGTIAYLYLTISEEEHLKKLEKLTALLL